MAISSESEATIMRLWVVLHRVRDALVACEDSIFGEYGLTTERYAVLATMKCLGEPIRLTDLALGLERTPNSVSMIVDRMVKDGLVRRRRDKRDRRVVYVTATSKAEDALKSATVAGLKFIREILSPLSNGDRLALFGLLDTIKYKAYDYLSPAVDVEEIREKDITKRADLVKRVTRYLLPPAPQAKRRGGKRGKAK